LHEVLEGNTLYFTLIPLYNTQEAFEKCWAHSPLRAAARRLFYIAIHQVCVATVARRLRIDVHNNINDNNDNA